MSNTNYSKVENTILSPSVVGNALKPVLSPNNFKVLRGQVTNPTGPGFASFEAPNGDALVVTDSQVLVAGSIFGSSGTVGPTNVVLGAGLAASPDGVVPTGPTGGNSLFGFWELVGAAVTGVGVTQLTGAAISNFNGAGVGTVYNRGGVGATGTKTESFLVSGYQYPVLALQGPAAGFTVTGTVYCNFVLLDARPGNQ